MEYDNKDWREYQQGVDYKRRLGLYTIVDKNERFYSGDQWNGVKSGNLPTPVFNIIKRVINYFIAALVSQPYKMQFSDYGSSVENEEAKKYNGFIEKIWENDKMVSMLQQALLDCAISGDMCIHTYWDNTKYVDGLNQGDFCNELLDNVNVFFGNVNSNIVNKSGKPYQPYIIISGRETVYNLKAEARQNNLSENDILMIVGDSDYNEQSGDRGKYELDSLEDTVRKATFIIRYYVNKETNTIWMRKSTRSVKIKDIDTKLTVYPLCWGNWDVRKNSYHGQAPITNIIPNQIYINKQFAMIMKHMMDTALSKTIYDETRITAWSNEVGAAIGVTGDVTGAAQNLPVGNMSSGILDIVNTTISLTKDLLGATDAALGNVSADNTSAIIAVQKSSAVPLELNKQNLITMIEDLGYIWLDFIRAKYITKRKVTIAKQVSPMEKINNYMQEGNIESTKVEDVEIGGNPDLRFRIKVDVGASTMWSELASIQTLDNLLSSGNITFLQYLERMPDGVIPSKQKLIDNLVENERKSLQENKKGEFESMAQFMETLPEEEQLRLQQMDPAQMELTLKEMMKGGMMNG